MKRAIIAVVGLALVVAASACGSGDSAPQGPATRMILEADTSQVEPDQVEAAVEEAADILRRRISAFGTEGGKVEIEGANRLSVELPGVESEVARDLVVPTALLEFRKMQEDEDGNVAVKQPGGEIEYITPSGLPQDEDGRTNYENVVWVPATAVGNDGLEQQLTGHHLSENTYVRANPITSMPEVIFSMTEEGSRLLEQVTIEQIGKPLALFLDGEPLRGEDGRILAPIVRGVITDQGVIEGLSSKDARLLSIQINAGVLPVDLRVVEVVKVSE